ncbi:flagellar hook-length control protein FliK [Hyphococcus luteus]|uniref:Flagellar hook-length control protein-like C-terminal domain-containing protein n=1 Tax=Hyphococcus luteus TaxID=2058213 RepID=A0A2S7K4H9_9PROT|nr:flagellar hook-length control protein FliK [Marinicaulis flavus]PQA87414.1 hypothetical protein CW354_11455 [Marinicaulis flavus]
MENAPLSILTALFGGKPAGDKSSGANALFANTPGDAEKGGQGFFSFIEGLLMTEPESRDDAANPLGAQTPFAGASVSLDFAPKDDAASSAKSGSLALTEEGVLAPGLVSHPEASADAFAGADAPAGPLETQTGPQLLVSAFAKEGGQAEGHSAANDRGVESAAGKAGTETQTAIVNAGAQTQQKTPALALANAAEAADAGTPSTEEPASEIDASLDTRKSKSDNAPGQLLISDQHLKTPGFAANPHANAAAAIAEHASPEALSYSAVTRDEGGPEFDRLATTRLETTSAASDRPAHLNPVRDQIVAAVAARHSDGRLEVRLDPPELGRVTIHFDRDGAEMVRAVVSADTPDTLDLMRRHADVFQRALEDQGFAGLDLQFTDQGTWENPADEANGHSQSFRLAEEEETMAAASGPAPQVALGRLDRRF